MMRHVIKGFRLLEKALSYVRVMGVKATLCKAVLRIRTDKMIACSRIKPYTKADIAAQRRDKSPGAGVIYVVADASGMECADALIASLKAQTYENWVLCLAGGALYSARDARIMAADIPPTDAAYIALLAQGCTLHPCALYEVMHEMTRRGADMVYTDETDVDSMVLYKPDYAPDTLRSMNYIGGFMAMKAQLLKQAGGIGKDGFYGLTLRLTENAKRIVHVQRTLCMRTKPFPCNAQEDIAAISAHIERCGLAGTVECGGVPGVYRIHYAIERPGLVSILIPNKDHTDDLLRCIDSLRKKTAYPDWEIIIIENNSAEPQTFACYEALQKDERIRVVVWKGIFNYAAINNFGENHARGKYLLLLNNDVEIIAPDWIEQMLMFAQREDVGAVGAMLYYPDDTVQHAGVLVGVGDVAGHAFRGSRRGEPGYMNRLMAVQNYSAITAACMLLRRNVYREIGGLDEVFEVAYNDVDMCMRIGKMGRLIVWTPYAEMIHYESKSRGVDTTDDRFMRYAGEVDRFRARWHKQMEAGDPYHNGNLNKRREDFGV